MFADISFRMVVLIQAGTDQTVETIPVDAKILEVVSTQGVTNTKDRDGIAFDFQQ